MLFLKVTRSVKQMGARFGWLIAELVFVFLGLYGAFLLERMHDNDMDLLRKKQILQALVDEFDNYEDELSSASHSLDEGYGIPFFTAYSSGEKPFPTPIPFGGMGSVNTGIWEAMLQSGGIEVLEVGMIQKVQGFFKKLQDLLDLYSRFERLSESMILPQMDREVEYFYESDSSELRNKYKWYVNSLFTVGMSLRELSQLAQNTKQLLSQEYEKTFGDGLINQDDVPIASPSKDTLVAKEDDLGSSEEAQLVEEEDSGDTISPLIHEFHEFYFDIQQKISESSSSFDTQIAVPFFTAYSEGLKPIPAKLEFKFLLDEEIEQVGVMIKGLSSQSFTSFPPELNDNLRNSLENCLHLNRNLLNLITRTHQIIPLQPNQESLFYELNSTDLMEEFSWYPNELFNLGTSLRSLSEEFGALKESLDTQL